MIRRLLYLSPAVPAAALLSAVWLPFVNTDRLWLGVPSLLVWLSFWVLMLTPAMLLAERVRTPDDGDQDAR